jgi:hypothetical protein
MSAVRSLTGVNRTWRGEPHSVEFDPERPSASEQPNPSYAWPHAVILSSVLVMRSSAFITVALAAKL